MAVINSLALYLSLLSMMMYGSYKMNYSAYETKTAENEEHAGLEKILQSLSRTTGRLLLEFHDKEKADSIESPEFFIDNHGERIAEILKTTTNAASNFNKGPDEGRRPRGAAISDSPITSSSPRPFRNNYSPRTYRSRRFLPIWISRLFKNGSASRSSTDEWVSKPTFGGKRDSPLFSDDTLPIRKRVDTTLRKNIWTFGTIFFKHTTKDYFLVFDKNGNMRSNVTIHRSFLKLETTANPE